MSCPWRNSIWSARLPCLWSVEDVKNFFGPKKPSAFLFKRWIQLGHEPSQKLPTTKGVVVIVLRKCVLIHFWLMFLPRVVLFSVLGIDSSSCPNITREQRQGLQGTISRLKQRVPYFAGTVTRIHLVKYYHWSAFQKTFFVILQIYNLASGRHQIFHFSSLRASTKNCGSNKRSSKPLSYW